MHWQTFKSLTLKQGKETILLLKKIKEVSVPPNQAVCHLTHHDSPPFPGSVKWNKARKRPADALHSKMEMEGHTIVRNDVVTVGLVELQDQELSILKATNILSGNIILSFG